MSSLAFLVTELQSLASETKRKHPEIREAAEKSLAILRSSPEQATRSLASDGPQSEDLLRPVFMGCATKNAKVVAISLGSLQRLIMLKAVPLSAVPVMINTMSDAMSQGVDIQLRILQTLTSLIPNFPAIHGDLLGDALLLCFKLQESKIAVVSSTAAATLRQLVMFVVEKMVSEDEQEVPESNLTKVELPDGSTKNLGPSAHDAFSIFEDLCLLANAEKPNFLRLEHLHKTFALELIESVLTNYHGLFRSHQEMILLLRHHLCPLILKSLSDRPLFPLILRCTRVVFLLLKEFSDELVTESEVFFMHLIKIIGDDGDAGEHVSRPQWMRVISMEIMRGLCNDAKLMRTTWDRFDSQTNGSKVFGSLISALRKLLSEKPALLGVCSQIGGLGLPDNSSNYGLDVGGITGRVAAATSATVSGVVGMMGASGGLSLHGSAMKLQCIDQLDKADAPPIPDAYIYLLALQCVVSLCEGLASFTGPLYNTLVVQKPRAAGDPVVRAPPALDIASLSQEESSTKQLTIVRDLIENAWPGLLASLSFIIATNLSDELFVEVLSSYQSLTNAAGMLGLITPRDALLNSLAKFAVPARVVSSLDTYVELQTPRTTSSFSENLGLTGPSQAPGLSERNMACLKVLISSAMFLAGSLGDSWFAVLEVLQNADYVLTFKGTGGKRSVTSPVGANPPAMQQGSGSGSASQSGQSKPPLLADLDIDTMQLAIQRLFDSSKNLEDSAYQFFISALCKLSTAMVEMQSGAESDQLDSESREDVASNMLSPKATPAHRRRLSGIYVPKTLRSGDFGITRLGGVTLLNIHRLIYRAPEIAWNATTAHLLSIIHTSYAPQAIRVQAAKVLDDILVIVPRNLSTTGDLKGQVQRRVLEVLSQQVVPDPANHAVNPSTTTELRRMGLETLHQILQASGHTLVVGWEIIFKMLESVCRPVAALTRSPSMDSVSALSGPPTPTLGKGKVYPLGSGMPSDKSSIGLVKIGFQSLTLVCDSISLLSPEHLRLCIRTLGQFGRQADTNIALTAATSLLWSVSDAIQSKRKNVEEEPEYSELWMFLLLELLGLCTDQRQEVRDGAIQTLFRTIQLYGSTLSLETWDQCIWKVTFPLLDSITAEIRNVAGFEEEVEAAVIKAWDDSKILALNSVGSVLQEFLTSKIVQLDTFSDAWDSFVAHIQETVLLDNRPVSAPALRSLEKGVKATPSLRLPPIVTDILDCVWAAVDVIGEAVITGTNASVSSAEDKVPLKPFTQESLVAFVDLIQSTRQAGRQAEGEEWPLEKLTRLMAIVKGVLTYHESPDYRPDIDALMPVQNAVLETVQSIDLTARGAPSLVLRDLSDYATLPFLAAFDPEPDPKSTTPPKRVTYIAVAKKIMPLLVDLFTKFKADLEIYADGTLEAVLSAYSIPVKLKYDCPAPTRYGKEQPLWKTATTCFLKIVKDGIAFVTSNEGQAIPDEHIEGIWHQILDVFRGGILADCTAAESFPREVQEAEENFDLALVASLEIDIAPHLGDPRVPDHLVAQLGKTLQKGSLLYDTHVMVASEPTTPDKKSLQQLQNAEVRNQYELGSTALGEAAPRERFSYWCFDLLFLLCSNTTRDNEAARRRLAALSIPALLNRCRMTLISYVADESLRGNLPFPRARENELLYTLRKLSELRLWPGSLWAAVSDDPSSYATDQPSVDTSLSPSLMIADAVKRSSVAHLFHFYSVLCEIASLPRKSPSAWVSPIPKAEINGTIPDAREDADAGVEHLDARTLARTCLREVGKEMGVSQ